VQTGDRNSPERAARIRRRDRHGRGLRGVLAPPGVPLHRSRAERFDDLVLQAIARLEPRWEAHLAGVEFAVEEIPAAGELTPGPVPLARLEPGSGTDPGSPGQDDLAMWQELSGPREPVGHAGPAGAGEPGGGERGSEERGSEANREAGASGEPAASGGPESGGEPGSAGQPGGRDDRVAGGGAEVVPRPPRIVVYRRPLMARADGDEDLGELVFEVVVEEFARLLGMDPEDVDPGYPAED
jgi:Zincin-like metallopeptidase